MALESTGNFFIVIFSFPFPADNLLLSSVHHGNQRKTIDMSLTKLNPCLKIHYCRLMNKIGNKYNLIKYLDIFMLGELFSHGKLRLREPGRSTRAKGAKCLISKEVD